MIKFNETIIVIICFTMLSSFLIALIYIEQNIYDICYFLLITFYFIRFLLIKRAS